MSNPLEAISNLLELVKRPSGGPLRVNGRSLRAPWVRVPWLQLMALARGHGHKAKWGYQQITCLSNLTHGIFFNRII